jgi:DNA ligase (NAD+)
MVKKQTDLMDILNNGTSKKSPPRPQDPQQERINDLAVQIRYHRHLYYNAMPEISDAKYDALEDELRLLA